MSSGSATFHPDPPAPGTTHSQERADVPMSRSTLDSWATLARRLMEHDRGTIQAWEKELDTVLVFAGLFSAALTAFNVELYSQLSPDPNQSSALILNQISQQLSSFSISNGFLNSTAPAFDMATIPTDPSPYIVRVNFLWFSSLLLSLGTSSMSMLAKQWLKEYMKWMASPTRESVHIRCLRFEAFELYGLFYITAFLPTVLQIAFALFLLGLIELLRNLNQEVTLIVILGISYFFLAFLQTTTGPSIWVDCPFRSPQSSIVRFLYESINGQIDSFFKHILPDKTSSPDEPKPPDEPISVFKSYGRITTSQTYYISLFVNNCIHDIDNLAFPLSLIAKLVRVVIKSLKPISWRDVDARMARRDESIPALIRGIKWAGTTFSDATFGSRVLLPVLGSVSGPISAKLEALFACVGPVFDIDFSTWSIQCCPDNVRADVDAIVTSKVAKMNEEELPGPCAKNQDHLYFHRHPIRLRSQCPSCAELAYYTTLCIDLTLQNPTHCSVYRLLTLLGAQHCRGYPITGILGQVMSTVGGRNIDHLVHQPMDSTLDLLKIDMNALFRMLSILVDNVDRPLSSENKDTSSSIIGSTLELVLHAWEALTLRYVKKGEEIDHMDEFLKALGRLSADPTAASTILSWIRLAVVPLLSIVQHNKVLWSKSLVEVIQKQTPHLDPTDANRHPLLWPEEAKDALRKLGEIYEVDLTGALDPESAEAAWQVHMHEEVRSTETNSEASVIPGEQDRRDSHPANGGSAVGEENDVIRPHKDVGDADHASGHAPEGIAAEEGGGIPTEVNEDSRSHADGGQQEEDADDLTSPHMFPDTMESPPMFGIL